MNDHTFWAYNPESKAWKEITLIEWTTLDVSMDMVPEAFEGVAICAVANKILLDDDDSP
jgi:hypothetical protein